MPSIGEYLTENGPVVLKTFGCQVGGHFLLMKFVGDTICKPLVPREHFFYESIPSEVRNFTPVYYGVISVGYHRSATGDLLMVAHPKQGAPDYSVNPKYMPDGTKVKCSIGESLHKGNNGITFKAAEDSGCQTNPWSEQGKKLFQGLGDKMDGLKQDYVVLENLTAKYDHPCILDLKLGTRQHGDDAPEEKVQRHTATCAKSTSLELGVRVCGMQKYKAVSGEYFFRDKYYGRQLDEKGFFRTLSEFLHNGTSLRTDLLPDLVRILRDLRAAIAQQHSYRLYSSSVLIIYDGKVVDSTPHVTNGLTVDCCKTSPVSQGNPHNEGVTLTSLAGHALPFSPWYEHTKHNPAASWKLKTPDIPPPDGESSEKGKTHRDSNPEDRDMQTKGAGIPLPSGLDLSQARHIVDVRMIDFAHATHKGYADDVIKYLGPDEGYIKGLTTLINAFEGMMPK